MNSTTPPQTPPAPESARLRGMQDELADFVADVTAVLTPEQIERIRRRRAKTARVRGLLPGPNCVIFPSN